MHNVYKKLPVVVNGWCFLQKKATFSFQMSYCCIMRSMNFWLMIWQQILMQIVTYHSAAIMLSSWDAHNWFLSLIFCEGYYKAAALTTDKLLQEHQEVNVSKLCLFYPLMTGVPNGYQVLISTVILGGKLWETCLPLGSYAWLRIERSRFKPWSMALHCVLGRDT